MTLLLDSHAAVWFLGKDARLSANALSAIGSCDEGDVLVSTASVWELEIKRSKAKFTGLRLDETALAAGLVFVDIVTDHARAAAELPPHHADPFDRMIVAQAIALGATLVSSDALLARYGVPVLW